VLEGSSSFVLRCACACVCIVCVRARLVSVCECTDKAYAHMHTRAHAHKHTRTHAHARMRTHDKAYVWACEVAHARQNSCARPLTCLDRLLRESRSTVYTCRPTFAEQKLGPAAFVPRESQRREWPCSFSCPLPALNLGRGRSRDACAGSAGVS